MTCRSRFAAALFVLVAAVAGCGSATQTAGSGLDATETALLAAMSPAVLPPPPADVTNRYADDGRAATLGQKLFFDPQFSGRLLDADNDGSSTTLGKNGQTGRVACAGCHLPDSGFVDTRSVGEQISLAAGWGSRKAPSLLDVGQDKLVTWDGRRDALYNQVFAPLESPVEMNTSRLYVAEQLVRYKADYEPIFGPLPAFDDPASFPQLAAGVTGCQPKYGTPQPTCNGTFHGMPGDKGEFDGLSPDAQTAVNRAVVNMGKAIEAYERLLTCGQGPFDEWEHGKRTALTDSQQRGAALFVGKGGCANCHSGPYFSDQKFHDVGLGPKPVGVVFADLGDKGAYAGIGAALIDPLNTRSAYSDGDDGRLPPTVTGDMQAAFKTPMLRCVSLRPSFMHTAQLRSLADVVAFFSRGGDGEGIYGNNELKPLNLSDGEQQDLVNFLGALTGPGPATPLITRP